MVHSFHCQAIKLNHHVEFLSPHCNFKNKQLWHTITSTRRTFIMTAKRMFSRLIHHIAITNLEKTFVETRILGQRITNSLNFDSINTYYEVMVNFMQTPCLFINVFSHHIRCWILTSMHDTFRVHVFYSTTYLYEVFPYRFLWYQSVLGSEILKSNKHIEIKQSCLTLWMET